MLVTTIYDEDPEFWMDPQLYEHLTAFIFRDLLENQVPLGQGSRGFKVLHRNRYIGKSGQKHEIDVSFSFELAGLRFLVLIECKLYSRPVDVSDVLTFYARIVDIGAQKGVMVTTEGYRKGAKQFAEANGIALVTFSHKGIQVLKGFSSSTAVFERPVFRLEHYQCQEERLSSLLGIVLCAIDQRQDWR